MIFGSRFKCTKINTRNTFAINTNDGDYNKFSKQHIQDSHDINLQHERIFNIFPGCKYFPADTPRSLVNRHYIRSYDVPICVSRALFTRLLFFMLLSSYADGLLKRQIR